MQPLTDADLKPILAEYATKFPALISAQQAAQIADSPLATIYDWSSRGLLNAFKSRRGKQIRLMRDAFVRYLMSHENS